MTRMIPLKIKDSRIVEIISDTAVGLTYLHGHAHSHIERIRESQRMIVIPLRVGRVFTLHHADVKYLTMRVSVQLSFWDI